jgi:hypothetical protein
MNQENDVDEMRKIIDPWISNCFEEQSEKMYRIYNNTKT